MISRISNYDLNTGWGTENITMVRDQKFINTYSKIEVLGVFNTGPFKHLLTFGVMSNERYASVPSTSALTARQNIYDPVELPAPAFQRLPLTYQPQDSKDTGIYAYDAISLGSKWVFLLGLRESTYKADNALATGQHSTTSTNTSSPGLGIIYNITPRTNIYTSYMKSLEETGIAPVGTVNQFQILAPASATQLVIGIRTCTM
jgi:iron complex outermembrane receptor protein